jgi:hypothetical protein
MPPGAHVQFTVIAFIFQGKAEPAQPGRFHAEQQRQLLFGSTIITFQLSTVSPTSRYGRADGLLPADGRPADPSRRGFAREYCQRNSALCRQSG